MNLLTFLNEQDMTPEEFALALKVGRTTAYRWVRGEAIPLRKNMDMIVEYTKGKVSPGSFYKMKMKKAT